MANKVNITGQERISIPIPSLMIGTKMLPFDFNSNAPILKRERKLQLQNSKVNDFISNAIKATGAISKVPTTAVTCLIKILQEFNDGLESKPQVQNREFDGLITNLKLITQLEND